MEMTTVDMNVINRVFQPHSDKKIFVVTKEHNKNSTKENKAPYDHNKNCYLTWSDKKRLMDRNELNKWVPDFYPGCGFITGITTNDVNGIPYPSIQCFDFDHVLEDGEPKHPELDNFLDNLDTFIEISAGGSGLHAIVLSDFNDNEWSFNDKQYWDGKYYSKGHFIKMTGLVYKNFDRAINFIPSEQIKKIKLKISKMVATTAPAITTQSTFNGPFKSWHKILNDNSIPFEETNYTDKIRIYKNENGVIIGEKLCVESLKIECPNKDKHTYISNPDKSAHKAILCRWEDGSSSLKCNHNACKPENKPNLLQMLWNQIHYKENYNKLKQCGWV